MHGFGFSMGSGGPLAGTAKCFRSASSDFKIELTDPCVAKMNTFLNEGLLWTESESTTEGINQVRITGNIEGFRPDYLWEVADREVSCIPAFLMLSLRKMTHIIMTQTELRERCTPFSGYGGFVQFN